MKSAPGMELDSGSLFGATTGVKVSDVRALAPRLTGLAATLRAWRSGQPPSFLHLPYRDDIRVIADRGARIATRYARTVVFGIGGSGSVRDEPTDRPALVLVRPAVNVAGSTTIRLSNPNGWYCFRSNVTVAGAIRIQAHCKAQIASAKEDGTSVGAVDESNKGVAVFGALRVTRFGCK